MSAQALYFARLLVFQIATSVIPIHASMEHVWISFKPLNASVILVLRGDTVIRVSYSHSFILWLLDFQWLLHLYMSDSSTPPRFSKYSHELHSTKWRL